jgi:integral membrane protein
VVRADWWFTTPTAIFQVASGSWMIWQAGWPWSAKWIWMTLALYAFAGLCWLPVV